MATAELQPSAAKIDKLLNRIEDGDIKIPAFQRGFVWTQEQIIELLDSIYHNYPIGSVLLWNSLERLRSGRNIAGFELPDRDPQYPVNYVLDGQQRLSTIYAVFRGDQNSVNTPQNAENAALFDIVFDFELSKFIPVTDFESSHAHLKLRALFDATQYVNAIQNLPQSKHKAAQEVFSRFNNYEIPIVTISKRSKDEVGIIFERINSTGTTLTTLDLMVAWTWSEDFHLKEKIIELLETLDGKGFGDLPEKLILQALSAILKKQTSTHSILNLSPNEVRDKFDFVSETLSRAVDFLSTELHVSSRELLPHVQQVVPLASFFANVDNPSQEQVATIKKWFWRTSFSKRYSAQTDDKMDEDIQFFERLKDNPQTDMSRYSYGVDAKTLDGQKLSKSNPYTRAFLLLLAQKTPLNLTNGSRVDLTDALSGYNRKEYHHVFPRAFLLKRGVNQDRINSLCNFCFLPAAANKKISQRAPSDYVFNLIPAANQKDILEANLLPLRMEVYAADDLNRFLELRSQLAMQFLDTLAY